MREGIEGRRYESMTPSLSKSSRSAKRIRPGILEHTMATGPRSVMLPCSPERLIGASIVPEQYDTEIGHKALDVSSDSMTHVCSLDTLRQGEAPALH